MLTIAVDFDGTIVKHKYPEIGEEIPFAIDTLKRLQAEGECRLILWSSRTGDLLQEAVDFCKSRGLEFYAVNKENPEDEYMPQHKVVADVYIDDRNLGGLPDWGMIYSVIRGWTTPVYEDSRTAENKKSFLVRLASLFSNN